MHLNPLSHFCTAFLKMWFLQLLQSQCLLTQEQGRKELFLITFLPSLLEDINYTFYEFRSIYTKFKLEVYVSYTLTGLFI